MDSKRRIIVGLNDFIESDDVPIEILRIGEEAAAKQEERLADLKARRDGATVEKVLVRLRQAARDDENLMPPMLDAVRAYATLGEIRHALEGVYGRFQEPVTF